MIDTTQVATHYAGNGLKERLIEALDAAGFSGRPVSVQDLAPLDQFHTRGLAATADLARAARIAAEDAVLDVGSGLGGPSRTLAATYGCTVKGIDLSPAFVEAADYLAERAGLAEKVSYAAGDALALPFADESFDVAWTQHVAMNIADRDQLYAEIHRVLRPGGRLAAYDVVIGSGGTLHFPVPWSRMPETSFVMEPDAMRSMLEQHGFTVQSWTDRTAEGVAWFEQQRAAQAQAVARPQRFGLHLAMGPDFQGMTVNLARNLAEGRARVIEAVLVRV